MFSDQSDLKGNMHCKTRSLGISGQNVWYIDNQAIWHLDNQDNTNDVILFTTIHDKANNQRDCSIASKLPFSLRCRTNVGWEVVYRVLLMVILVTVTEPWPGYNVIMGASHNIISLPRAWRPGIHCTGGQFYYPACSPRNISIGGVFG